MSTETGDLAPAIEAPVDGQAPEVQQPQAAQPTVQEPATETAQPAPPPSKTQQPAAKGAKPVKGDEAVGGEKKLSGAELKKLQKAEKAARRASQKAAQASQAPGQAGQPGAQADGKGAQNKQKQGGGAPGQQGGQQKAQHAKQATATALPVIPKEVKPAIPEIFSHLSMARRISIIQADKDVNPAVLVLGQYMSTFALTDSITRLETTLYAFKKVIDSYTTPHGTTFSRHFTSHVLNPQIDYLTACRPMCFSMGNAIRWLKLQISKIDIDLPDIDAKKLLCESIDNFIRERVNVADQVIVSHASELIEDGSVILTYAQHHLIERTLLYARASGKDFGVIVVDDPYERVGIEHAKVLAGAGIRVTYASDFGALRAHLKNSSRVLLAAEAMFSNGAMYARAGTCDIAMAAKELGIKVTALCETINFTERVSIDSLTYNEIDPEQNNTDGFRLLFDTTTEKYIETVVTELGESSPCGVPSILRKLEEL